MSGRVVRASLFRHVFGTGSKSDQEYTHLKARSTGDATFITANASLFAYLSTVAGRVHVHPWSAKPGRLPIDVPAVAVHRAAVLDMEFSPLFHHDAEESVSYLATCGDDGVVMITSIPNAGFKQSITEPTAKLVGHDKRVNVVRWHPTAYNIIGSGSADATLQVWDINRSESTSAYDHKEMVQSIDWHPNGHLLTSTAKDGNLRVLDPRQPQNAQTTAGFSGPGLSRAIWLGDKDRIIGVGSAKGGYRQYAIWDLKNLSKPLVRNDLDSAGGAINPYFDPDNSLLYLSGKGESSIRYFEVVDTAPYLHYITEFRDTTSHSGVCFLPKRYIDQNNCEIACAVRLCSDRVSKVSFRVPRKNTGPKVFHADLYPDTLQGQRPASVTAQEWLSGQDKLPFRISMKPGSLGSFVQGTTSQAAVEAARELYRASNPPSAATSKAPSVVGSPVSSKPASRTASPQQTPRTMEEKKKMTASARTTTTTRVSSSPSTRPSTGKSMPSPRLTPSSPSIKPSAAASYKRPAVDRPVDVLEELLKQAHARIAELTKERDYLLAHPPVKKIEKIESKTASPRQSPSPAKPRTVSGADAKPPLKSATKTRTSTADTTEHVAHAVTNNAQSSAQHTAALNAQTHVIRVNAFTSSAGQGNPAGVCIIKDKEKEKDETWMRLIAREMNVPETAFLVKRHESNSYDIRWFTETGHEEVLCGHATLAAAHVLYSLGIVAPSSPLTFYSHLSGLLSATCSIDAATPPGGASSASKLLIKLNFPAKPIKKVIAVDHAPEQLFKGLGLEAQYVSYIGDNGLDWLVQVDSVSRVQQLTPTFSLLKSIPARGIIVTAGVGAPDEEVDEKNSVFRGERTHFVSRVFFGREGTGEDPVTGSAHCALATHWAGIYKAGPYEWLTGYQASSRGGIVRVCLVPDANGTSTDDENGARVLLAGHAFTVMDCFLRL